MKANFSGIVSRRKLTQCTMACGLCEWSRVFYPPECDSAAPNTAIQIHYETEHTDNKEGWDG